MQTRTMSMIEAALNTASGFLLSVLTTAIVFPMFGFPVTVGQNVSIVGIFTAVSVVRSYVWRRVFNRLHEKPAPPTPERGEYFAERVGM